MKAHGAYHHISYPTHGFYCRRQRASKGQSEKPGSAAAAVTSAELTPLAQRQAQSQREEDEPEDDSLWGADMTVLQSLPVLWDLLGETGRELAKRTGGVSLQV